MAIAPLDFGSSGDDDLGGYRPLSDINVTPFVDVMLVLLIVFMVAAPLMMSGVPLDLPKTSAVTLGQPKQPIIVSMSRDGKIFVKDEEVAGGTLIARLSELYKSDPNGTVYVRGDKGLEYGRIMTLMGQIGQSGFSRVSLIAESAPTDR